MESVIKNLRILLVDDEPLARYACRKMITDKFSGYEVVGEASTGPEALESFRVLEPDIILMDIELPEINGLEVSLLILKEKSETQIIIVSAYEHFGYAQKAINTGVLGYVLKPIQEDSLRSLLEHAARNIASFKKVSREQNQFHLYRSLAIKDMVTSFIHGSYGGLTANSFAQLLSKPINEGVFMVCSVQTEQIKEPLGDEERLVFEQAIDRFPNCYAGHWIGSVLPVFVSAFFVTVEGSQYSYEHAFAFAKEFIRYTQAKSGYTVSVRMGRWQTDPIAFPYSFHQAFDLLQSDSKEQILISRTNNRGVAKPKESEEEPNTVYPLDIETKLLNALIHGEKEQVHEMEIIFSRWLADNTDSETEIRYAITELLIQIRRNQVLQVYNQLQESILSLLRLLDQLETSEEILNWFPTAIDNIIGITDKSVTPEETNIQKILHYIDMNDLGTTISLENIADFIGLSPQYISKLFKQQFNINFIDYVIQQRIKLACNLLKTTELPVKDVATRCGYNDVSYFSKVFGKFTGLTPREYRQKIR